MKRSLVANELSGWRRSEIIWLTLCELITIGLSLYWQDDILGVIAATTGIAYTVFAGKGKISCYLFGIINTPLYAFIAWKNAYYGDMALNIYYFVVMFALFFSWRNHRQKDLRFGIERTRLSSRHRLVWLTATIIGGLMLWKILLSLEGSRPLADAFTNAISIAAMMLTVKRCVEQWIAWIAVDLIEVFMWFKVYRESSSCISLLIMWALFLANGIYLWRVWIRDEKAAYKAAGLSGAGGKSQGTPTIAIE